MKASPNLVLGLVVSAGLTISAPAIFHATAQTNDAGQVQTPLGSPSSVVGTSQTIIWQAFPSFTGQVFARSCGSGGGWSAPRIEAREPGGTFTGSTSSSNSGPWSVQPGRYIEFRATARIGSGTAPFSNWCFSTTSGGPVIAQVRLSR